MTEVIMVIDEGEKSWAIAKRSACPASISRKKYNIWTAQGGGGSFQP